MWLLAHSYLERWVLALLCWVRMCSCIGPDNIFNTGDSNHTLLHVSAHKSFGRSTYSCQGQGIGIAIFGGSAQVVSYLVVIINYNKSLPQSSLTDVHNALQTRKHAPGWNIQLNLNECALKVSVALRSQQCNRHCLAPFWACPGGRSQTSDSGFPWGWKIVHQIHVMVGDRVPCNSDTLARVHWGEKQKRRAKPSLLATIVGQHVWWARGVSHQPWGLDQSTQSGLLPASLYRDINVQLLDLGTVLVIPHAFIVADLAADSHLLGMHVFASYRVHLDLQASLIKTAGHSYQIVHEDEQIGDQPGNLTCDAVIPAGCELLASATLNAHLDHDPIMIGDVSGWRKFAWKFPESGLVMAHSTIDTRGDTFPIRIIYGTKPSASKRDW